MGVAGPARIHAVGGGEALNAFHYVSGNMLQARDPIGLDDCGHDESCSSEDAAGNPATPANMSTPEGAAVNMPPPAAQNSEDAEASTATIGRSQPCGLPGG